MVWFLYPCKHYWYVYINALTPICYQTYGYWIRSREKYFQFILVKCCQRIHINFNIQMYQQKLCYCVYIILKLAKKKENNNLYTIIHSLSKRISISDYVYISVVQFPSGYFELSSKSPLKRAERQTLLNMCVRLCVYSDISQCM